GEIVRLVADDPRPMVVDADALNAVAQAGPETILCGARGPRLLTPHPGEMARLWPENPLPRRSAAAAFAAAHGVTLLWKGARTLIACEGRPLAYNSTGHPGMASGGMGDVLTGVLAGLLAPGKLDCAEAARLGAWLCGRAAERAVSRGGCSPESTVASDVLAHLGGAFTDLRRGCF
ncbi:MAG: NAD(P)H-hydrate dehydratase, partial [Verrucomicrobiales bacterium]